MGHNTPSTIASGAKYQTARDIPYGHGEINQISQLTVSPLNLANPISPILYKLSPIALPCYYPVMRYNSLCGPTWWPSLTCK